VPFWLPQMDVDIRKQSRYGKVEIHRPYQGTPGGSNTSSGSHSASASPRTIEAQPYNEPVSDDDGEEEVYTKMVGGLDEAKQVKLPDNVIARVNEARAFREDKLRREAEARAAAGENGNVMPAPSAAKRLSVAKNGNGPNSFHIDPLSGSRQHDASYSSMLDKVGLSKLFKTKAQREEEEARGEEIDPDSQPPEMIRFNAPLGKRIAVPVRIEPKVIFANEVRPASLVIGHVRLLTKPPSLPLRRPLSSSPFTSAPSSSGSTMPSSSPASRPVSSTLSRSTTSPACTRPLPSRSAPSSRSPMPPACSSSAPSP
jgi:hypothetical protein